MTEGSLHYKDGVENNPWPKDVTASRTLRTLPAGKGAYDVRYRSAPDAGALPRRTLARRREKEAASLAAFRAGPLPRIASLADAHMWMHTRHSAYTATGMLSKRAMNASSALAQTY